MSVMTRNILFVIVIALLAFDFVKNDRIIKRQGCLRCQDFNKYPNPRIACAVGPGDCGDCFRGFKQSPWDYGCIYAETQLIEHPQHTIVQLKGKVVLSCSFSSPVECEWYRRGKPVLIRRNYKFISKETDIQKENCSIQISSVQKRDLTFWQCSRILRSPKDNKIFSHKANLIAGSQVNNNCNSEGDTVVLNCTFNVISNCSWQKNGKPTKIVNRYKYIGTKDIVNGRTDCSIKITKIRKNDLGKWKCETPSNSFSNGVFRQINNSVMLCPSTTGSSGSKSRKPRSDVSSDEQAVDLIVLEHPTTSSIDLGETFYLTCKFSMNVTECIWLRHGQYLQISLRYQYYDGNNGYNTSDCSLVITSFQEIDVGDWACGSVSDDENDGVISQTAYLYVERSGPYIDILERSTLEAEGSDTDDQRSPTYLIVISCLEAVIIVTLLVVIVLLWKSRSKDKK